MKTDLPSISQLKTSLNQLMSRVKFNSLPPL